MRRRRQLEAPEPLEMVLDRAGENRFAKRQLPVPLALWRAAVGPRIADRARPIALERGVLVIKATTSVWANELSMLAPKILEKLAESLPNLAVKSLRFRVGPLDVVEGIQEKRTYRQVPPPAVLSTEMERSLEKVEDDELRTLIASAASRNLAWQHKPPTAAPPIARAPRDAGRGSAPPVRTAVDSDVASRCTPEVVSSRRR
jgi:hypothetical protein